MKVNLKQNNGITLIALVITIVVLLILAGVTIAMLTGENGILGKATTAKSKNDESSVEEKIKLSVMYAKMNTNGDTAINLGELKSELEKNFNNDVDIQGEENTLPWIVASNGYSFEITENGEVKKIDGISIPQSLEIIKGNTKEIKCTKSKEITEEISWKVNDTNIVDIDKSVGDTVIVTAKSEGQTELIASANGKEVTCTIKVVEEISKDGTEITQQYLQKIANGWLACINSTENKTLSEICENSELLKSLMENESAVKYYMAYEDVINPILEKSNNINVVNSYIEGALVPQMTSNTEPSGEAIASSEYSEGLAYKAFNGSNEGSWDCWHSNSENEPWIGYKFEDKIYVNKFKFVLRNDSSYYYLPAKLAIDGSNDGQNWNEIEEYTYSGLGANSVIEQYVNNNNMYQYYRIRYKGYTGYGACGTLQFYNRKDYKEKDINKYTSEYKELIAKDLLEIIKYKEIKTYNEIISDINILNKLSNTKSAIKYIFTLENNIKNELLVLLKYERVPLMTSNTEPSGEAIASSELKEGNEAFKAFNRSNEDENDCWHSRSESEPWIGYKFENKTYVNKFKFVVRKDGVYNYAPTKLAIDGSNDGQTWNEIEEYTYSNLGANSVIEQDVNNNNMYQYYRIRYKDYNGYGACGILQFYIE